MWNTLWDGFLRGLLVFMTGTFLIMTVCLVFVFTTFTPAVGHVADYMKDGRLTMFILGATVGMFFASVLFYFVFLVYMAGFLSTGEKEKKALGISLGEFSTMKPTPRELSIVKKDD